MYIFFRFYLCLFVGVSCSDAFLDEEGRWRDFSNQILLNETLEGCIISAYSILQWANG